MSALEGASKYLNNLLLARGLLPHGKAIDFAHPQNSADGSTDATMTKIINLVHELVLRRDKESEQHESMAGVIRDLRTEESQRLLDFQKLQDKNVQLRSEISTAQAQERTYKQTVQQAEGRIRDLKEQALKMKSILDQVRAKCINDVRKKDLEIEKLKGHIVGLQRGKKDLSGMKIITINPVARMNEKERQQSNCDVDSGHWSLEKETNDFLAALVNETSTENVSLRQLVEDTIFTMKELTGMDVISTNSEEDADGIGIPGQYRKSRQPINNLVSCQTLAEQMSLVVEHCRTILKDPSFVPIEEVNIREEEIFKLKAGWEKMADRWKEAITMMSQWKQRMIDEGKSFDVGEFSDLSFGRSIAVRPDGKPVLGHDDDLSSIYDQSAMEIKLDDHDFDRETSSEPSLDQGEESELELEPEPEPAPKRLASSPAKRGLRLKKPSSQASVQPLSETNGNRSNREMPKSKVQVSFQSISDENGVQPVKISKAVSKQQQQQSKLTVAQKLAAVEAEAAAAEAERKNEVTHKRKAPSKMTATRKTSRRRSTLSPDELAALMGAR